MESTFKISKELEESIKTAKTVLDELEINFTTSFLNLNCVFIFEYNNELEYDKIFQELSNKGLRFNSLE
ncbi:MAG TPA: hypothetical protein DEA97_21440 [Bacteroidales bacterium]|nr:MAG: hypothetical protein UR43_C0014G0019 [candidate division TM6 bacterium GW2011_GWF2_33_332]HBS89125.1 hypothetical protein [Bacteroidales bacterium]